MSCNEICKLSIHDKEAKKVLLYIFRDDNLLLFYFLARNEFRTPFTEFEQFTGVWEEFLSLFGVIRHDISRRRSIEQNCKDLVEYFQESKGNKKRSIFYKENQPIKKHEKLYIQQKDNSFHLIFFDTTVQILESFSRALLNLLLISLSSKS